MFSKKLPFLWRSLKAWEGLFKGKISIKNKSLKLKVFIKNFKAQLDLGLQTNSFKKINTEMLIYFMIKYLISAPLLAKTHALFAA